MFLKESHAFFLPFHSHSSGMLLLLKVGQPSWQAVGWYLPFNEESKEQREPKSVMVMELPHQLSRA